MKADKPNLWPSFALVLACMTLAPAASAVELEHVIALNSRFNGGPCCLPSFSGLCGVDEHWERWPSSAFANGGIPWTLVKHTGDFLAPGLPYCTSVGAYPDVLDAAKAWNTQPPPPPPIPVTPGMIHLPQMDSDFRIMEAPTAVVDFSSIPNLLNDSTNHVVFVDDAANASLNAFSTLGTAHVAIAAALVNACNPGPGGCTPIAQITGFDILLNATSRNGVPVWAWTTSLRGGNRYASHTPTGFVPYDGYVDIQGVLTHEFGHAAGLAHSVVDGKRSGALSNIPVMFPFAQPQAFEVTLAVQNGCGTPTQTYASSASTTLFGGLLGQSARDPKADDIASINRAYPDADFASKYGTITGTTSIPGLSIVAVNKAKPQQARIGVLTYYFHGDAQDPSLTAGTYRLSGLKPGDYYVFAEPVDRTYFPLNTDIPNYVLSSPYPSCRCGGFTPLPQCSSACPGMSPCQNAYLGGLPPQAFALGVTTFPRELFNSGESGGAELGQLVAEVTVQAGTVTSGINFVANTLTSQLRLEVAEGAPTVTTFSRRGRTVPAWADSARTVPTAATFRVTTPSSTTYNGKPVQVILSYDAAATVDNGQLREVSLTSGITPLSGSISGGLFSAGYTLAPATQGFSLLYAQARIEVSTGVYDYTNPVSLFVGPQEAIAPLP